MKRLSIIISLMSYAALYVHAQNEISNDIFSHLKENAIVLSEGELIKDMKVKKFVSSFEKSNGEKQLYKKNFGISVNTNLDYEIGEIQTSNELYHVMFLKTRSQTSAPTIEFLVIYKGSESDDQSSEITARRNEWMELCNAHKANDLVKQLYTSNAYYYNRGRLLEGTKAISAEYGYMNSSGYSLKLTPKHVVHVTPEISFEIGRCSGSYPLPYMLLWEKQSDGTWQILMDSNY